MGDAAYTSLGTATTDGSGNFSITPTLDLVDDDYSLTIKSTDVAGNTSLASTAFALTIDTTAPSTPVITTTTELTKDKTPQIVGNADPNNLVKLFVNGVDTGDSVTSNASGNFSIVPTLELDDGDYSLTVKSTDEAGNDSAQSAALEIEIDTTPPEAPEITTTTTVTNETTPTIEGTSEAGSTITLSVNGISSGDTFPADEDGNFSITPSLPLNEGLNSITVTSTDSLGNISASSTPLSITIDITPPDAPVITTTTSLTNNSTPTIEGTAELGSTVELFNGDNSLGTATTNSNGVFSITPNSNLNEGENSLKVIAYDSIGNPSLFSSVFKIEIDTTAPSTPVITTTTTTTNETTPTIEGTAEAGSTVELFNGDTSLGTVTAGSDGSFSITSSQLTEGIYSLTVKATDGLGNESEESAGLTIEIDTTPPSVPIIDTAGTLTKEITHTITGTAIVGTTITLFNGDESLGTATADSDGNFSFTETLSEGDNVLTVTATDTAGNESAASSEIIIEIDTTPPSTPSITTTTELTNNSTPTIEGIAEAGSTVELFNGDTSLGTATAGSDGSFSIISSQLPDNSYTLTVKATDALGNESEPSNELVITIDTTAPSTPSITTTTDLTNNPTPTIEGTAEPGSTVELFNGAISLGTATAGSDGSFSITTRNSQITVTHLQSQQQMWQEIHHQLQQHLH